MNKKSVSVVSTAARILLAFVFVLAQTTWAGQNQRTKEKVEPASRAVAQTPPPKQATASAVKMESAVLENAEAQSAVAEESASGSPHEGIKVHGHWTIEVRNPDGTLVTHREFENSLAFHSGTVALAALLSRGATAGQWYIGLIFSLATGFCGGASCYIAESTNTGGIFGSYNLTVAAPTSSNVGQLVLSGSFNSPAASTLIGVSTNLSLCPPNITPLICSTTGVQQVGPLFTSAILGTPVNLAAGQIVQVTVAISFS